MWKEIENGFEIAVKITPKSNKSEILGWEAGELKIRIAAIPEKGNANSELIRYLAKQLGIAKSQISLLSGEQSRHKRIQITGMSIEEAKNTACGQFFQLQCE